MHIKPLRAVLPLKQGSHQLPTDPDGVGGINLGQLERLMRQRWQTISGLWETNKTKANRLNLLGQLDYMGKLSSQLEWQENPEERLVRLVYASAGQPTAAVIEDNRTLVDYKLFWVACKDAAEANYLLAIINSDALYESAAPLMSKGQFGARDVQKHLWKLPIPEYNPKVQLHVEIAQAGASAAAGAADQLVALLEARGGRLTSNIARREIRKWLRDSDEGKAVESAVTKLLTGEGE